MDGYMLSRISAVFMIVFFCISTASAEIYQWVDDNGVVTFKDTPPPSSKKRKKVKVYQESDYAPPPSSQPPPEAESARKGAVTKASQPAPPKKGRFDGTVELYVTEWCGYCKKALRYMESNKIPYVAYDIEKDSSAKQRYKELQGRGVPLIIIGSQRMSGFSAESFEYYLNNGR
jgi:glutaredoxin